MLTLLSHAVNACDTWQWVATGGEIPTLAAPACDFGRDSTTTNLKYMRSLSQAVPIRHALRGESGAVENRNALRSESSGPGNRAAVRLELHRGTRTKVARTAPKMAELNVLDAPYVVE